MSVQLKLFNLVGRFILAGQRMRPRSKDGVVEKFRDHARIIDSCLSVFGKASQPVIETDDTRWYWVGNPADHPRKILYLHGGGFMAHLPKTYRKWADKVSRELDAAVLLVDYRLAPEHPFPAAIEDSLDAYRWLLESAGCSPQDIIVAGDSAGGNLGAATLLRIRQAGLPQPCCAILQSPGLDMSWGSPSIFTNEKTDYLCSNWMLPFLRELYLGDRYMEVFSDPLVSPMFAELDGIAPIQLHVSDTELLLDDARRFKQIASGQCRVDVVEWHQTPHCHALMSFLPESGAALQKMLEFVSEISPQDR